MAGRRDGPSSGNDRACLRHIPLRAASHLLYHEREKPARTRAGASDKGPGPVRMDDRDIRHASGGMPQRRIVPAVLKALTMIAVIAATAVAISILHEHGSLRAFLDRQSIVGITLVVLVVNAVGFGFVYMVSATWKAVKRDLGRDDDW